MRVRNWKKFQHFSNRKPPWIKVYRDILDDHEWHALDGDSAKVLMMLWLLASEYEDGELPPINVIAFRFRMPEKLIKSVVSKLSGWLDQGDITAISPRYQDDPSEREIETERETEGEARKRATRLPPDWQPSEAESAYAKGKGLDVAKTAELFRNYWHAKSSNATKLDWTATWRNWCINESDRTPANRKPEVRRIETPPTQDQVEAARRKAAADNAALHAMLAGVIQRVP
jgi:hypothetical protein